MPTLNWIGKEITNKNEVSHQRFYSNRDHDIRKH